MDGCSTHVAYEIPREFFEELKAHHVEVLKLPPNLTHILQPLDLHWFGVFGYRLGKQRQTWRNYHNKSITKKNIHRIVLPVWDSMTPSSCARSFEMAQLWPPPAEKSTKATVEDTQNSDSDDEVMILHEEGEADVQKKYEERHKIMVFNARKLLQNDADFVAKLKCLYNVCPDPLLTEPITPLIQPADDDSDDEPGTERTLDRAAEVITSPESLELREKKHAEFERKRQSQLQKKEKTNATLAAQKAALEQQHKLEALQSKAVQHKEKLVESADAKIKAAEEKATQYMNEQEEKCATLVQAGSSPKIQKLCSKLRKKAQAKAQQIQDDGYTKAEKVIAQVVWHCKLICTLTYLLLCHKM